MNLKTTRRCTLATICLSGMMAYAPLTAQAAVADSLYLFTYNTGHNSGRDGLHYAWSTNKNVWQEIGPRHAFVKSDYGTWGSQKRMLMPYVIKMPNGTWKAVWQVNENANQFAVAESDDLIHWVPQDYPYMKGVKHCEAPVLKWNNNTNRYEVFFKSEGKCYRTTSTDFYHYTDPQEVDAANVPSETITLNIAGESFSGQLFKVPAAEVNAITQAVESARYRQQLYDERAKDDQTRFAGIQNVKAEVKLQPNDSYAISNRLVGIFFEDINYAADGGLYAEMVQNRDFEYSKADRGEWNATTAWNLKGDGTKMTIATDQPLHANNPHYALLNTTQPGASLSNTGYDGMVLHKGETYNFSIFHRLVAQDGKAKSQKMKVSLVESKTNKVLASTTLNLTASKWKQLTAKLTVKQEAKDVNLVLEPQTEGSVAIDMVSLFPQHTFNNRKNGLRADLAQALADLKPKFIRFPGGCAAHGNGLDNMYRWNESIGPLESRKPDFNIWNYHQTRGLGYFEYFQFCEDIGAEPLPVLPAGVCCQNSSRGGAGQQGGIPMEQMPAYIDEVLHLIEWANGNPKTSEWAKKRAEAGHPKPFNLKYIGIGNEDLISNTFTERYLMIVKAIKQRYPDIIVCGTVGPWCEGSDYEEGWRIAQKNHIDMVDEHYYQSPGWFIHNQHYYDQYDRNSSKVYLGEYASHLPGRPNNMETALSEAIHLCSVERNGDVVELTSYAPLLAKKGHTQWTPDMIYFTNESVEKTTDYYVQQMHSVNSGDHYIPCQVKVNEQRQGVKERIAISTVSDSKTGKTYLKMVNMMPCTVTTSVDATGIVDAPRTVNATLLSGNYDDRKATPQQKNIDIAPLFTCEMPAYSFIVIPLK